MTCSRCKKNRNKRTLGFCESLQIQMKAKLLGSVVYVEHQDSWVNLSECLVKHGCAGTPGSVLAQTVLSAVQDAVKTGKDLSSRHDKPMPLVLLKHFLYKELGR